ncbi:DNA-damage-inducible protein J [Synergistales bacterium]|nr:DNA-damage-inducible protein J [Synergistales bacterium]
MAQLSIKIDDNLKEQAELIFGALGLNISTAFDIFVRQTVREGGIPFYSETNLKILRQSIKDANDGKLTTHELIED